MSDQLAVPADEICDDPQVAQMKRKQMSKLKGSSLLHSISDTFKFMAGVLTTVAMAVIVPNFATAASAGGLAAGIATVGALGAGLLVAAGVATLIAVGASYKASRIWHDGQFNNLEINAKSTANHLVEALKANNLCLTDEHAPARADGKSWCEYTTKRQTEALHAGR